MTNEQTVLLLEDVLDRVNRAIEDADTLLSGADVERHGVINVFGNMGDGSPECLDSFEDVKGYLERSVRILRGAQYEY
jgi:hypothetical protein